MQDSVDIRKWLNETVQPEAPREPINLQKTAEPAKRKRRRRSDSSILGPRPPASSPPESVEDSADEAPQATRSDSSGSDRYARKPRRKTHPERYAPGPHAHHNRKGESKERRRKPRRKKGEKAPAVMQTFQAKNVSGDRLTLKPRELGLFNKGRTSTAIKGRGLPDLVFSEMKFLQKHRDESESVPRPDAYKKKRKKDHEQAKEGEISAFFTSVRPALVETDHNILSQHPAPKVKRHLRVQSSEDKTAMPTVEVANQASYLGFGSRGPRHESNSYVSWSESIRAPSTAAARPRDTHARLSSRDVDLPGDSEPLEVRKSEVFKLPVRPSSATKRRTDSTPIDRFRVSSLALSQSRTSRSQSYPQHTSSPRRPNLVDRSAKLQATDDVQSPSSMPPSAPKSTMRTRRVPPPSSSKGDQSGATPISRATPSKYREHDESNEHSLVGEERISTSSDLGAVLRHCNDTFHERCQVTRSRRRHTEGMMHQLYPQSDVRQGARDSYRPTQQAPTVRFADQIHRGAVGSNFAGPSIYEQQAQCQQSILQEFQEGPFRSPYPIEQHYLDEEDRLEYDDQMEYNDPMEYNDQLNHDSQYWDGLPEEPLPYSLDGDLDMYDDGEAYDGIEVGHVRDSRPENDTVAPGFWRPNKLY